MNVGEKVVVDQHDAVLHNRPSFVISWVSPYRQNIHAADYYEVCQMFR